MRVLQINKFLWRAGGVESYMFDLSALLESNGHEVVYFSMEDPRNRPSAQAKYFASHLSYGGAGALRHAGRILGGTVYSFESREKLRALLRDLRPDVAHVHLIDHHLSPSVLHALRDEGVPVVQTVHEYKLVCPNYQLYIPQKRELCERCLPGKFYNCAVQRCMKDSLPASVLAAGSKYFHRAIGVYEKNVAAFLYATDFVRSKLVQGGMPREKLRHVPLYINLSRFGARPDKGDYIVYAGRLSPEKGVRTLIEAMRSLPDVKLRVLGEGPSRGELETFARDNALGNVEFAGFVDGNEYVRQLGGALALVLPSEWYETCGLVLWEAAAMGVPVVASRIGGIPESVKDNETGLLFEPKNGGELAQKIRRVLDNHAESSAMAERAGDFVRAHCGAHYERIMAEYIAAIAENAA